MALKNLENKSEHITSVAADSLCVRSGLAICMLTYAPASGWPVPFDPFHRGLFLVARRYVAEGKSMAVDNGGCMQP